MHSFLPHRRFVTERRPIDPFALRVTRRGSGNERGDFVLYHAHAARRLRRNVALDYAVTKANELRLPVLVIESSEPDANARLAAFVRAGVQANARDAAARGLGYAFASRAAVRALASRARLVVSDEFPTRAVDDNAHVVVDGNGILPMRVFGKEQYTARFLRDRAHRLFPDYWAAFDDVEPAVAFRGEVDIDTTTDAPTDDGVPPVATKGGRDAALARLQAFDVTGYADGHNRHPSHTSGLSPYLHFGHIGIGEVAERILLGDAPQADIDNFLEEAIIRRELSFNFCFYNPHYDWLAALPQWARATLDAHRGDRRKPAYDEAELEQAATYDDVWNIAQRQLVATGTMHGYLRMLWGKKAIEWMETPERAHAFLVAQHAKYALDGRDPNTHAGVLWCFGKHDRPWAPERPIFGTIRWMSSESTRKKVDLPAVSSLPLW